MFLYLLFFFLSFLFFCYCYEGFFNQMSPSTRNQSYDIRGDPFIIPKKHTLWYNSSIIQTPNLKLI
jgi:hypothetical protein